jgi:hypothetical protein
MAAAVGAFLAAGVGIGALARGGSNDHYTHFSADEMAKLFQGALPTGSFSQVAGTQTSTDPGAPSPGARLVFDDGHGASQLALGFGHLPAEESQKAAVCPNRAHFPYDRCTSRTLPDGSHLIVDQGFTNPLKPEGVKLWYALLTTKDGRQVSISELNAASEQATSPTRPSPPLSLDQLSGAVSSRHWDKVLAGLPALPAGPRRPSQPTMSKQQILRTLKSMLPPRVQVADEEGDATGYVDVTVDDGHGKTLMTVNVQRWQVGYPDLMKLYQGAEKLADGTLIQTRQVPARDGTGATSWEKDVLYPDGRRVMVTEYNASAFGLPRTRQDLPLTMEQLSSIATNPDWRH